MREQAALSAAEITADTVNDFIANSEVESNLEEASRHSKGGKSVWERFLMNFVEMSSSMKSPKDVFHPQNGSTQVPKVNGKHNRQVQNVNLESEKPLTQGNGVAKMKHLNIPTCKEVLPGLESWKTNKVASWHSHEGHSIQWLCVVCIDRRGNFILPIKHADYFLWFVSERSEMDFFLSLFFSLSFSLSLFSLFFFLFCFVFLTRQLFRSDGHVYAINLFLP